jgi:ABC-type Zn uptake system ZnuABC Zn-binding protein ZnuA
MNALSRNAMKASLARTLTGLSVTLALTLSAAGNLNVVATLPDFAAIAGTVGGTHVKCTSLARGSEDAHFVDPRPSFIRVLNRADVLLHGGAELEIGWLPPLVDNARNARILTGRAGNVSMADGVPLLEVPTVAIDRSQGDIHRLGNPHYWLDPANGPIMAEHLAHSFSQLDPDHAEVYKANAKAYGARIKAKLAEWERALKPLEGTRILTYHKTYEYLAHRFSLEIVGYLEPLPGIEPSPTHIAKLIPTAKEHGVRFIIVEPFRPGRTAKVVAEAVGAQVVVLPDKVGAVDEASDPVAMFDSIVDTLLQAQRGE